MHTIRAVVNLVGGGTVEITGQAAWSTMIFENADVTETVTPRQELPGKHHRVYVVTAYSTDPGELESEYSNTVCTNCGRAVNNIRVLE